MSKENMSKKNILDYDEGKQSVHRTSRLQL